MEHEQWFPHSYVVATKLLVFDSNRTNRRICFRKPRYLSIPNSSVPIWLRNNFLFETNLEGKNTIIIESYSN